MVYRKENLNNKGLAAISDHPSHNKLTNSELKYFLVMELLHSLVIHYLTKEDSTEMF